MPDLPLPFAYEGEKRTAYKRRGAGLDGLDHERLCSLYCGECKRNDQSLMATVYRVGGALVVEKLSQVDYVLPYAGMVMSGVPTYMWMVGTVDTATLPIMCRNCRVQRAPLDWKTIVNHVTYGRTKKLKVGANGVVTV